MRGFFYVWSAGNGQIKNTMSEKMRAKFQMASITDFGYGSKLFKLGAVYSNNPGEDNQFSTATPSGSIEIMVSKEGAMDFLKHGKKYYVDFTEAPEES